MLRFGDRFTFPLPRLPLRIGQPIQQRREGVVPAQLASGRVQKHAFTLFYVIYQNTLRADTTNTIQFLGNSGIAGGQSK